MRLLAKDDVVQFQDGDVEREGHVVVVDRFRRSLDVKVDGQRITVPVQHLKPKGRLHTCIT